MEKKAPGSGKIAWTSCVLSPLFTAAVFQRHGQYKGLESMQIHIEKGEIVEIGSSEFDKDIASYSHISLAGGGGKNIKITNVFVDSNVMPKIAIGTEGYFAIIGKATKFGLGERRNGILAFADSNGLTLAKEPSFAGLVIAAVIIAAMVFVGLLELYNGRHPAELLFGLPVFLVFLFPLISMVRGRALLAEARTKFAALGITENAVKVY
jgi:hypothetical protein